MDITSERLSTLGTWGAFCTLGSDDCVYIVDGLIPLNFGN